MKKKFTFLIAALALLVFMMPSLVGWGQSTYTKVTSIAGINTTDTYIIVCENSNVAMKVYASGNNHKSVSATISNGTATDVEDDVCLLTLESTGTTNQFYLKNQNNKYLLAVANQNYLKVNNTKVDACKFTLSYSNGVLTITSTVAPRSGSWDPSRMRYNSDNDCFACYGTGQNEIAIYKKEVSYTINPVSNNNSYGTVSLSGKTITATPAEGYRVMAGDEGYTVISGTVTVVNNGNNTFSITPQSDCTVQINFELIPSHTATFSVNGTTISSQSYAEGAAITFPSNPAAIQGKVFTGWVTEAIVGTTDDEPSYTTTTTMGNGDVTYYAVFATASGTAASLTKMTSSDTFAAGDKVVIVADDGEQEYAMYQETTNSTYVNKWSFVNNVTNVAADDKNWLTVSAGTTSGTWKLGDATNGYVYNNSSNNLKIDTDNSTNFTLAWNSTQSKFTLKNGSNYLSYRSDLTNNYFRMGGTSGSGVVYFDIYKYVPGNASYSNYCTTIVLATKEIEGYTDDASGWYLIASPSLLMTPTAENGFITNTYDLYRFDQTGGENNKPWRNYKQNDFDLISGTGYLYANSDGTELTFTGQPYNGNGEVGLTYVTSLEDDLLKGLNLVGNPFNSTATINKPFYRMNNQHNGFTAEVAAYSPVNPMEGVFVYATAVDQTVTFTPAAQNSNAPSNNVAMVAMNLVQNRSNVIDRAIVCFDSEDVLPKFQLFENSTKLYIKKDGKDYAIVGSKDQGEMPVNFVAAEDGQYTITVNTENIEMGYLHLIDNIAGKDIDLLATPSYTFNAKGDDYESRFRLVFSANMTNAEMGEEFAFISDGELIINGTGTLQVFDVLGRNVFSKEDLPLNSHLSTLTFKAGVYVLRLINGTDVKTQKIVIR